MVYELDVAKRQLRMFKDHVFTLERHLRAKIHEEYEEALRRNLADLRTTKELFSDFKADVAKKLHAEMSAQLQLKEKKIA